MEEKKQLKWEEESGVMMEQELHEYVHFPVCGTNTGWFHCSTDYTHSDIADELGLGISIYFKQLKALVIMLSVCVLLSIPSCILFYHGSYNVTSEGFRDTKSMFASLTLGNIGHLTSSQCRAFDLDKLEPEVVLECTRGGEISALTAFGTGPKESNRCMQDKIISDVQI